MTKPAVKTPHGGAQGTSAKSAGGSNEGTEVSASQLIDARIKALNDWRGDTLARVRA